MNNPNYYMLQALKMAEKAQEINEVPVGSVIVCRDEIIAYGYNQVITTHDPTAHAEIMAIREASNVLKNYRLVDCELYVTLEPCSMCIGAMIHARIKKVYFGAFDYKTGAISSVINLLDESRLNHHTAYEGGILAEECGQILSQFFKSRRLQQKQLKNLQNIL